MRSRTIGTPKPGFSWDKAALDLTLGGMQALVVASRYKGQPGAEDMALQTFGQSVGGVVAESGVANRALNWAFSPVIDAVAAGANYLGGVRDSYNAAAAAGSADEAVLAEGLGHLWDTQHFLTAK